MNKHSLQKFVTIIFCFQGCFSIAKLKNNPESVFMSKGSATIQTLRLSGDSTFEYSIGGDLSNSSTRGSWSYKEGYIYLTSDSNYKSNFYEARYGKFENKQKDYWKIVVKDETGLPLPFVSIKYRNQFFSTDTKGSVIFKKTDDDQIEILYLGQNYSHILKLNGDERCLEISLHLKDNSTLYLQDEKWKIKKNEVITKSGKKLFFIQKAT